MADSITSVSPSTIPFGASEEFLTIRGDGFVGSVSTLVVFDGQESVEPGALSSSVIVVWVPGGVTLTAGTHTVDVYATDFEITRHIGPATFTVAVPTVEPGPPSINTPEIVVAEYDGTRGGTPVSFDVNATHFDGSPADFTCSPASGSGFSLGTTSVQCTATDQYGSSSASFLVVVVETVPPILTLPQDILTDNPVVTFTATATDNFDGELPVTCTPASGSTFLAGTTTVQCRAFDSHFNYAFGSFDVTVTAGAAPAIKVPEDVLADATSSGGAILSYEVVATGDATISCSPASGSLFPIARTTVNCTATNPYGSASGSFVVTVVDQLPPVLTLPSPTVPATSPAGAVVNYTASASDVVEGTVPITCSPASGSLFPIGATQVDCTASDSRGNQAFGTFFVTVTDQGDTTPPVIVRITASPDVLWPPNHKMVTVTLTVQATDDTDPSPISRIISVSSNQPINGTGDGDTAPDWSITGPLQVELRAERAGTADRTYKITVETVDASGNRSRGTVEVKVTQTRRRAA